MKSFFSFISGVILAAALIGGVVYIGANFGDKTKNSEKNLSDSPLSFSTNSREDYSFQTGLKTAGFPRKLVENGIFVLEKYQQLAGPLTQEEKEILNSFDDDKEIVITSQNNQFYLNLFWGLGLAQENNYLVELKNLEEKGQLDRLASTGGWEVAEKDAVSHFSKHNFLNLSPEQQKQVADIASTIYRPCCNNSARFADCNHGMAMLGVLALGISQGLSDDDLYYLALKFNSLWFPNQYNQIADYFEIIEKKDLKKINPRDALSSRFSSAGGFSENVSRPLSSLSSPRQPKRGGGGGCSL